MSDKRANNIVQRFKNFFPSKPEKAPNPRLPYTPKDKKPSFMDKLRPKQSTEPDFIKDLAKTKVKGIRPKSSAEDPLQDKYANQDLYFPVFTDEAYTLTKAKAKLFRFMRDTIPDISAGVWAWTKICDTKRKIVIKGGTDVQKAKALDIINKLDERLYEHDFIKASGMDILSSQAFTDLFTVGSTSGEVWIAPGGTKVNKFLSIPPETIRFKRKNRVQVDPYQYWESSNSLIKLNPATLSYIPLNMESNHIYGKSLLTAVPFVSLIQNSLMRDMSAAMHNAGYVKYVFTMTPPPKVPSESMDQYKGRVSGQFNEFVSSMKNLSPEDNIAVYDNIKVSTPSAGGGGGSSIIWYDSYKAVEEQVISGLKLAPFMIGRNYDTTGEFGTAQYDLILRNANSVQKLVANQISWLMNLELAMAGSPCRAEIVYDNTRTVGALIEAQADLMRVKATIVKRNEGILSQKETAEELGRDTFDYDGPNPKYNSSQLMFDTIPDTMPTNSQSSFGSTLDHLGERELLRMTDAELSRLNLGQGKSREVDEFRREEAKKKHKDIEGTHDIEYR